MAQNTSPQTFVDPVCAMEMILEHIEHTFVYMDHTYYFCTEACQMASAADPEKYLEAKPVKRKGIWAARFFGLLPEIITSKPTRRR